MALQIRGHGKTGSTQCRKPYRRMTMHHRPQPDRMPAVIPRGSVTTTREVRQLRSGASMHRPSNPCRVCGFGLGAPPWGVDGIHRLGTYVRAVGQSSATTIAHRPMRKESVKNGLRTGRSGLRHARNSRTGIMNYNVRISRTNFCKGYTVNEYGSPNRDSLRLAWDNCRRREKLMCRED